MSKVRLAGARSCLFYLGVLLAFGACNSASKTSSSGSSAESTLPISGTPPTEAHQDLPYSFTPQVTKANLTFSIQNKPSWASFSSTTGALSGTPNVGAVTHSNIIISVTDGTNTGALPAFSILVHGDPLKSEQWFLRNTTQKAFSSGTGVSGIDLNLMTSLVQGIGGTGVRVAISDTGAEIAHADLRANVLNGESRDYRNGAVSPYLGDPSPSSSSTDGDHGTSVAGILAAEGWNGIGIRGVAPFAHFAVFNYLSPDVTQNSALRVNQADGNFDIFSESYGIDATSDGTIPSSYLAQLIYGTSSLRSGKGALYVKAAGNSFTPDPTATWMTMDANEDYYNSNPYTIVVGALNASGLKASYASAGACLWISGFGGEFGTTSPALITTDRSGCAKGYAKSGATQNSFEGGGNSANSSCDYTSIFNGTSGATPTVSGAIALILQANSNLTWRDVKHVLASTATKVDGAFVPIANRAADSSGLVWEPGWIHNAAGYNFHNYYGFGKVNVDAAVAMARSYSSGWSALQTQTADSGTIAATIPDDSAAGVTQTLSLSSNLTIEAVQVEVTATHPYTGDLGFELVSPSGTKSVILHANNNFENDANLAGFVMLSNAFYGEGSQGTWMLRALDAAPGETGTRTLTNWKLKVYGH
ncbi:MAG: S8 family serine peptidase [Bdellovibrionales bacterium]|nr:S8 family serine peptidase [Bdellovibrionales bacterium]